MAWNFADLWESVSDEIAGEVVLIQGDRRVTWGEFDDRAARLAAGLSAVGLGPGSKVASYLLQLQRVHRGRASPRGSCGAVPVNVNYRYLEDELRTSSTTPTPTSSCSTGCSASTWPRCAHAPDAEGDRPGRRRHAARRGRAFATRTLIAAHEPVPRDREVGRRPLHPLHRRHHRHAEGRDVAQRGPLRVARPRRSRPRRRDPDGRARRPGRRGRDRRRAGARRCTCPRRRSCTAPAFIAPSRRCSSAARS